MSRNRVIYQSEAVYVSPSPATGVMTGIPNPITQLHRIQSANYDLNVTRQDINQFAQLAALSREIIEAPTVSLTFDYLVTNALNEKRLGFTVDGSCTMISGILSRQEDEKNYFILTVPEGQDAAGYAGAPSTRSVIGIGNGFISSYSVQGAVGGFPTASVTVEGLNMAIYNSSSGQQTPAVNPVDGSSITGQVFILPNAVSGVADQVAALRPGDITLSLGSAAMGVNLDDIKAQSFNLEIPLTRENQDKLGSKFSFSKEIQFPLSATMTVEANVGDLATGRLNDILCNDVSYDLAVTMRKPACVGQGEIAVIFELKGAKLDSQSFSSSIGSNKSVSLTWSAPINGPQQLDAGIFCSGVLA